MPGSLPSLLELGSLFSAFSTSHLLRALPSRSFACESTVYSCGCALGCAVCSFCWNRPPTSPSYQVDERRETKASPTLRPSGPTSPPTNVSSKAAWSWLSTTSTLGGPRAEGAKPACTHETERTPVLPPTSSAHPSFTHSYGALPSTPTRTRTPSLASDPTRPQS